MYRWDRLAYLQTMCAKAKTAGVRFGAKLVRGAYMEKERDRAAKLKYKSPIQADKASTDRDFDAAVRFGIEERSSIGLFVGTHNETSTLLLAALMLEHKIAPNDPDIWFSQLFGMSDNLSFNLAKHQFNVAKYLPYGPVKSVLPYLFRRAAENTSIKGQAGRELTLIEKELKRRKS
jgi:proline dehydrogenase